MAATTPNPPAVLIPDDIVPSSSSDTTPLPLASPGTKKTLKVPTHPPTHPIQSSVNPPTHPPTVSTTGRPQTPAGALPHQPGRETLGHQGRDLCLDLRAGRHPGLPGWARQRPPDPLLLPLWRADHRPCVPLLVRLKPTHPPNPPIPTYAYPPTHPFTHLQVRLPRTRLQERRGD